MMWMSECTSLELSLQVSTLRHRTSNPVGNSHTSLYKPCVKHWQFKHSTISQNISSKFTQYQISQNIHPILNHYWSSNVNKLVFFKLVLQFELLTAKCYRRKVWFTSSEREVKVTSLRLRFTYTARKQTSVCLSVCHIKETTTERSNTTAIW